MSTLRRFFGWLVFHEVLIQSPLQSQPRCCPPPRRPFIFDRPQAQRLLEAAAHLREGPHGPRMEIAESYAAVLRKATAKPDSEDRPGKLVHGLRRQANESTTSSGF